MFSDRKWCRTFLIITAAMFFVGVLLYGLMAVWATSHNASDFPPYGIAKAALGGGWLLSGLLGGILMFTRWIREKSTAFKVVCAVLFMFTVIAIMVLGILATPFMMIYCLVVLVRNRKTEYPSDISVDQ